MQCSSHRRVQKQLEMRPTSECDFALVASRSKDLSALCPEDSFHLADLLLDFPAYLFVLAFGFQVGIICQLSCLLLNLTLHFVNLARYLILGTWLHLVSSCE